jgi:hypothetical protein
VIARDRDAANLTVAKPLAERPSSSNTASGGSEEGRFATGTILAGPLRWNHYFIGQTRPKPWIGGPLAMCAVPLTPPTSLEI